MPPAYTDVCLSPDPNATLQGTGFDAAGRKQYRYSHAYREQQRLRKYNRGASFGRQLGMVRRKINRLLESPSVKDRKAGIVLRLLDSCSFRPGSLRYLKENGTYGASTLDHRHFRVTRGGNIEIKFKGKAGVMNRCQLRDELLAELLLTIRTLQGAGELAVGVHLKDFRTFGANAHFLRLYRKYAKQSLPPRQRLSRILNRVAAKLSNTPTICKKRYITPALLNVVPRDQPVPRAKKRVPGLSAVESDLVAFLEGSGARGEKL